MWHGFYYSPSLSGCRGSQLCGFTLALTASKHTCMRVETPRIRVLLLYISPVRPAGARAAHMAA